MGIPLHRRLVALLPWRRGRPADAGPTPPASSPWPSPTSPEPSPWPALPQTGSGPSFAWSDSPTEDAIEIDPLPTRHLPVTHRRRVRTLPSAVVVVQPVGHRLLAAGMADGSIAVNGVEADHRVASLDPPRQQAPVVAIAGVGETKLLAAWAGSRTARLWDYRTGQVDEFLASGSVTNLVPLRGGGRVAASIDNRNVELWEPALLAADADRIGEVRRRGWASLFYSYSHHVGGWRQMAMADLGGGILATASGSTLHLGQLDAPSNRSVVRLGERPIRALFALSRNRLLTADEGGVVHAVDLTTGELTFATVWNSGLELVDVVDLGTTGVGIVSGGERAVYTLSPTTLEPTGWFPLPASTSVTSISVPSEDGLMSPVVGFGDGRLETWSVDP